MIASPIVTAEEMRAAEDAAVAAGTSVETLMERAGKAVADHAWRMSSGAPILIVCGPGNNGGDGFVAARILRQRGASVRVAAMRETKAPVALTMRKAWGDPIEALDATVSAPILVDALFGTGLRRPLEAEVTEPLAKLMRHARHSIAVDLPSGVGTDDGALLGTPVRFDTTLALGALKPAHRLQPSADMCGTVLVADIGVPVTGKVSGAYRGMIASPRVADHKYSRGMIAIVGGAMPGASELAAVSALRAGAGYVLLLERQAGGVAPHAVVRRAAPHPEAVGEALSDKRIAVLLAGPGLGRDDDARLRLDAALTFPRTLVLDGDALVLLGPEGLEKVRARTAPTILTPHMGEFEALFGRSEGSKLARARAAAERSGAIVVAKGPDTVLAHPDGRAEIGLAGSPWLSIAGTGDVLAGAVAARAAVSGDAFTGSSAGILLHQRAASISGPGFIADDLAVALTPALALLSRGR